MARTSLVRTLLIIGVTAALGLLSLPAPAGAAVSRAVGPNTIAGAAAAAQQRYGVPATVLEAICYLEGQLSDHGGAPSAAGGYGCMDLARNNHVDTLDQAARLLAVPVSSLRGNQRLNIAGAAAVLRADAISLSASHRTPGTLGGWYGAVAMYSGAGQLLIADSGKEMDGQWAGAGYNRSAQQPNIYTGSWKLSRSQLQ